MKEFLLKYKKSSAALFTLLIALLSTLGFNAQKAVFSGIQPAADYSTSLASQITSSATTMTVVSTSTPSGEVLTAGQTYGLKLGGREYVIGTLSAGKQFTSLTRGVSLINGTTTGGVAEAWGRGTSVEITTAPILLEISNKLSGTQNIDAGLTYSGSISCTASSGNKAICPKDYIDAVAVAGASNANDTTKGIVEMALGSEAAIGTSLGGTGARLVLGSNISTSTCQIASNSAIITQLSNGKIASTCVDQTASYTLTASTTFNGGSTGTSSFSGPVFVAGSAAFPFKINNLFFSGKTGVASSSALIMDSNGAITNGFPSVVTGNNVQAQGSTGNQTITHNLGRIPNMIEITATTQTAQQDAGGNVSCGPANSFGVSTSTSGTSQYSVWSSVAFLPGTPTVYAFASTSSNRIVYFENAKGGANGIDAQAILTDMTATTFTLNWTTNTSAAGTCTGKQSNSNRNFVWKVY